MRAEWRDEEEEITKAAYEQWRHGRSLAELLAEIAGRGQAVHVSFASATFRGPVTEIGPDRFTIAAGPGPVDVAMSTDAVIGLDRSAGARGASPAIGPSMRARLLEHETADTTVRVGTAATELRGKIVVGSDHVVVTQGELDRVVVLEAIRWVRVDDGEMHGKQ
jgi:hypothetical protein